MRQKLIATSKIVLIPLCLGIVLAAIVAVGCFGEQTETVEAYWGEYQGGGNSTIIIEKDKVVLKGKEYSYTKNGSYIRLNDLTQGTYRLFGDDILCLTSALLVDVENTRYFDLGSFPTRSGYFEQTLTKLDNRYNVEYVYMFEANGTYTVAFDDIRLAHHGSYTLVDGVLILTGQDYLTGAAVNEMSYISADMWFYPVAYVKDRARYTNPGSDGSLVDEQEHVHSPVRMPEVAPTCTVDGYSGEIVCATCGEVLQESVPIPALDHDYAAVVTPPTCTEQGYTTYTCTRCRDSYIADRTAPQHTWGGWSVAQDATCTTSGLRYHVCTLCGTTGRETIYALGHAGDWVVDKPASCATGVEHRACPRCGLYETKQMAPTMQHDYGTGGVCKKCGEHAPTAGLVFDYGDVVATVRRYTGTDKIVYIPSSAAGLPVNIERSAFESNAELISVVVSDGVLKIGDYAFSQCSGLTSVVIPPSVTNIGEYAFSYCTGLTQMPIGSGVMTISRGAYAGCTGLTTVVIPNRLKEVSEDIFRACTELTAVTISDGVTSIGHGAFNDCYSLASITIPESVTSIGSFAFQSCYSLADIVIPESVTNIGDWAFSECYGLDAVTIGNGVTSIGEGAFCECTGLTAVVIPASVKSIGSQAFDHCIRLTVVFNRSELDICPGSNDYGMVAYYAKNVYTDEDEGILTTGADGFIRYADGDMVYLLGYVGDNAQLIIPDDIGSIYAYAFYCCRDITTITIGTNMTSIGNFAFYECSSLTDIYYDGTMAQWATIVSLALALQGPGQSIPVHCADGIIY